MSLSARLLLVLALVLALPTATRADDRVARRLAAQNALIDEHWEYRLREFPELATARGDPRYADRWTDYSPAGIAKQRRTIAAHLKRLKAIDSGGFAEQDRLNHELLARELEQWLQRLDLDAHLMPVDHFIGAHLQPTQVAALAPLDTPRQVRNYVDRLNRIPAMLAQLKQAMRQGRQRGLMPPRGSLEKVVEQCRNLADTPAAASVFAKGLERLPGGIAPAQRQGLRDAVIAAIDTRVRPAYRDFAAFVADEYAPAGRTDPGLWAMPGGDARYRFAILQQTTLALDPEAIHRTGLAEVARIEAEQERIARQLGYADLAALRQAVRTDRRFYASSREQILERYRAHTAQIAPKLPQLFGVLPKTPMEILPVEAFRERTASAASYMRGTPDGSRAGRVYVNTGDHDQRLLLPIEAIAYHEGLPGHHLQISIAQAVPSLPAFRSSMHNGAYSEGWGLYAERLAKEVGQYQDPINDYGRLSTELLRAVRLVLDTGVHHKRWTREQMVAYFRAHSSSDEPSIQSETDRYIAWPAQALTYKVGEMKLIELRQRAQAALGPRFDLRAFHDLVLGSGPLPLEVLQARVEAWTRELSRGSSAGSRTPGPG